MGEIMGGKEKEKGNESEGMVEVGEVGTEGIEAVTECRVIRLGKNG
jgi:hypothetical protein